MDVLRGICVRIRYQAPGEFFVAILHTQPIDTEIAIVGNGDAPPIGVPATFIGEWGNHSRYGKQFKVQRIQYDREEHAIQALLASGFLKHVKAEMAGRIAAAFGSETFRVLDEAAENDNSKRLEGVKGIGPYTGPRIAQSWTKQRGWAYGALMCIRAGLTMRLTRKARVRFGDKLAEVITEKPYRLTVIRGVTWEEADRIAKMEWPGKEPIPHDSLQRYAAAFREALEQGHKHGHLCLPLQVAITDAKELAQPNMEMWPIVEEALEDEELVLYAGSLYIRNYYDQEAGLAGCINSLAQAKRSESWKPLPVFGELDFAKYSDFEPTGQQREAVRTALEKPVSIITGGPGTGKTTILQTLVNVLEAHELTFVQCSPTGKAAHRMKEATGFPASTIHRALQIKSPEYVTGSFRGLDFVIIDEASMMDASLAGIVTSRMSDGSHLVLIGDVDQLPSVGPGEVLYQLIAAGVPTTRLTTIHRQSEKSGIVKAAHAINRGEEPKANGGDCYIGTVGSNDDLPRYLLQYVPKVLEKYDHLTFDDLQVLTPVNGHAWGQRTLNITLQEAYNPGEFPLPGVSFKADDKVIHLKNNYQLGVLNGMTGQVTQVVTEAEEKAAIKELTDVEDDDGNPARPHVVFVQYNEDVGMVGYTRGDLGELALAYAITIHKSQGSEFEAVIMLMPLVWKEFMLRQLAYTGLTRAKKYCLVLQAPGAVEAYASNEERVRRYTNLAALLIEKEL